MIEGEDEVEISAREEIMLLDKDLKVDLNDNYRHQTFRQLH